jgi:hypothetical protein
MAAMLAAGVAAAASGTLGFDEDAAGKPPAGLSFGRTGGGGPGQWVVRAEKDAPSPPNVLAQVDTDATDYRFPVAIADAPVAQDVKVSVKCKPVAGGVDRACGVVFRYLDAGNYYVARANALEDNTNLYYVKDGRRHEIAGHRGKVTSNAWHDLAVEARGDHLQVFFDGKAIIDAHDRTFTGAGKSGLWTKADSVTYFDDLVIQPLGPS